LAILAIPFSPLTISQLTITQWAQWAHSFLSNFWMLSFVL
jgi:hypothetical protein